MKTALFAALFLPLAALAAQTDDARLAEAARGGNHADVEVLLGEGVDVNLPGPQGTPPLHWAAYRDDLETARVLIDAGADVTLESRYGLVPLYLAAANGNVDMIRLILDAGADPNQLDPTGDEAEVLPR